MAEYLLLIDARKERLAVLQDETESLRLDLNRFEVEYHAVVGTLFIELAQIKLAIHSYEERIYRLQADIKPNLETIEADVDEMFRADREEIKEQVHENRRFEEARQDELSRPTLSVDEQADLHQLYRALAKRFHPDLAPSEAERIRREGIMRRINAAMQDRDLPGLKRLLQETEVRDEANDRWSVEDRLEWLKQELVRLDGLIADLEANLAKTRLSDVYQLFERARAGEPITEQLRDDLQAEIALLRELLPLLVSTYQDLVNRHWT